MDKEFQKVLPLKEPVIKVFTGYSHLLAILQCKPETYEWIYSNFLMVYLNKDLCKNSWGEFYHPMPYEIVSFDYCKWIKTTKVRKSDILVSKERILAYLQNELANDYYVNIYIDHSYFSFPTNQHVHDAMIYGMDTSKGVAYIADVLNHGVYEFKEVALDELLEAIINCKWDQGAIKNDMIVSYAVKEESDYEFNIENIKNCLRAYRDCTTLEYWSFFNQCNMQDIVFGLDIYKALIQYTEQVKEKSLRYIDVRMFSLLKDHKIYIKKCLQFLVDKEYAALEELTDTIEFYEALNETLDKLEFMVIKYIMRNNPKTCDAIVETLWEIYKKEENMLNQWDWLKEV